MRSLSVRIPVVLIALALSGIACNFAYGVIEDTTGISLGTDDPHETSRAPSGETTVATPATTQDSPESPDPAAPEAAIPADVLEQMAEIETEVILLRGLQPTGPVDRQLLSEEGLRDHVVNDFFGDYTREESEDDAQVLALLGLVEPGFNIYDLYLDLYSEGIAGFYDPDVREMFVVQGSEFGGPERLTYSHEYAHVLQDQIFDIRDGLDWSDEACEDESERCAAIQALIEGDATLLEERWLLTYASDADFQQLLDFYETYSSPTFDSAPEYLKQDFLFPYTAGFDFVEFFFLDGGWAAVDALYANPPTSTEQILHPNRYPGDIPVALVAPELLDTLGPAWREMDRDVLGEWFTFLMLREYLSEEQARPAAEGWGGDYYVALQNDEAGQGVLVLGSVWDSVRDAHDFYTAFRDYGDARFGDRTLSSTTRSIWDSRAAWSSIEVIGDQTLWILAPDSEVGERVRDALAFPADRAD